MPAIEALGNATFDSEFIVPILTFYIDNNKVSGRSRPQKIRRTHLEAVANTSRAEGRDINPDPEVVEVTQLAPAFEL